MFFNVNLKSGSWSFKNDFKSYKLLTRKQKMTKGATRSLLMTERVFLKNKSKVTGDRCIFKFLSRSVRGKRLTHFQGESSPSSNPCGVL